MTATMSLADVIRQPPTGRPRAVVLDFHDYAQRVFLKGRIVPWGEVMAYSNFLGQAQGVLKSDALLLPLDRFYAELLAGGSELRTAMAAKSRTGFALRTLLADADATKRVVELASTFVKTQRSPVVLQVASPLRWLSATDALVGRVAELDADDADTASMYVADLMRGFAALPLAGILLDDRMPVGSDPGIAVGLDSYSPIANVTEHYGWTLALRREDGVSVSAGSTVGVPILAGHWLGEASASPALPPGDFLMGEIPAGAVPETVMSRVSQLGA
jgi:hypothetical protein